MGCVRQLLDPAITGPEADRLEADLRSRIVGQDENIRQIVSVYQAYLAGLASPGHPVGNFLFLGPTGTGKTRMVEAIAESLAGDARAVVKVKIDCAEFQQSHEIAKLIGSPPGYLGHRETHAALSQEAINRYHTDQLKLSFVLFDEIEKASDSLWNLLLGILDKATLTLGDNRQVDFSACMIFMTSNLGAREMMSAINPGTGFVTGTPSAASLTVHIERAAEEAARRRFTPEFLNRIDKMLVFQPLGEEQLRRILDIELAALNRRFRDRAAVRFELCIDEPAKSWLLQRGTDMRYGARHLKREIERSLVHPLANLLASGQVRAGDRLHADAGDAGRGIVFYRVAEDLVLGAAAQPEAFVAQASASGGEAQVAPMRSRARGATLKQVPASLPKCG
jgi:ATP-dependent Clp protease ATP-binding subunit ClpB